MAMPFSMKPNMVDGAIYQSTLDQFSDLRWRINNIYWILDKEGRKVRFQMNWAQEALFNEMHFLNDILKARQLGFTTFIQLFMLDAAVFNTNIRAGTIAHNLLDAQTIFRDKVKYPYDNLPEMIRASVPTTTDSATELVLANNSSIRVGTSLRSGTLQYLHVSEYGKLCAKYPEKAREVRTGALNTVQAGQIVFIESTAEGQEGHFYDLCSAAMTKHRLGTRLTPLDFKFHFYPWWKHPDYSIDSTGVIIEPAFAKYFAKIKDNHGIELTDNQKAWYVKKCETQLADMKREYPSTPEEAFEASIEGAYYAEQIARAEHQGRIGQYKALKDVPVHSAWDIGVGDATAIWFFQITESGPRIVGYYENNGEGATHYVDKLREMARLRNWKLGNVYLPHDAKQREWGSGRTRFEQIVDKVGSKNVFLVPVEAVDDGINAVRAIFPACQFDEEDTADGLKSLRAYRKEWDEERACWRDKPRHDWASHGADGFRYFAFAYRNMKPAPLAPIMPPPIIQAGPISGTFVTSLNFNQLVARNTRARKRRNG